MAKTADAIAEWPLLCDALAFVTGYTKSESTAKALILKYYEKGRIAHSWWQPDNSLPGHSRLGRVPLRPGQDDKLGVSVVVDWSNSCVSYIRTMPDPSGPGLRVQQLMKDFLPTEPFIQAPLFRLRRRDLIDMLVEVGLMATEAASPSSSQTRLQPKPKRVTAASRLPDAIKDHPPKPEWTNAEYARHLHRFEKKWKAGTIANALSTLRPKGSQKSLTKPVSQKASQK